MLIAVTSSNTDIAGAITHWSLTGRVSAAAINATLASHGVASEHYIRSPNPRAVLRRVIQTFAQGGDLFLRTGRAHDGALYMVRQVATAEGPEFRRAVRVTLSVAGQPRVQVEDDDERSHRLAAEIPTAYWTAIDTLSTQDVSAWLIDQAAVCDGLSMRAHGGFYFISRLQLDTWRTRVAAVEANSMGRVFLIPAMRSEEAFDAIVHHMIEEAQTFTERMIEDLDADTLGERALQARAQTATDLLDKMTRLQSILDEASTQRLAAIRQQVEDQRTNAVQAALLAGAQKDGAP